MRVLSIALAALATSSLVALAEEKPSAERDMSTLTCQEFLQMNTPDAVMTLFWIDGYLASADGTPVWSAETFVDHRDRVIKICAADDGKEKLVLEEIKNLG